MAPKDSNFCVSVSVQKCIPFLLLLIIKVLFFVCQAFYLESDKYHPLQLSRCFAEDRQIKSKGRGTGMMQEYGEILRMLSSLMPEMRTIGKDMKPSFINGLNPMQHLPVRPNKKRPRVRFPFREIDLRGLCFCFMPILFVLLRDRFGLWMMPDTFPSSEGHVRPLPEHP